MLQLLDWDILRNQERFGNAIIVSAYESRGDMRRGVFDPIRYVFDGLGHVMIGRTTGIVSFCACVWGAQHIPSSVLVRCVCVNTLVNRC